MIPVLYESSETEFKSNGIGRLSDAIKCLVTEERNGQYELEMQYPVTGIHYSDLRYGRYIAAVPAYLREPQPFEIYKISKPLNGRVTVYARHVSYRLSKIPVLPFTANSASAALDGLKSHAAEDCPFTFWTDKTTAATYNQKVPNSLRGQLGGIEGSILDVYGGEYEWDKWTVKLWNHRGTDHGVEIRYGKNLVDLTQEENIADTATGICPYWTGTIDNETVTVTLPEKVIETDTAKNFPYHRTVVIDLSSQITLGKDADGNDQKQPTVDQLRQAAQAYIKGNSFGVPSVSLDVKFQNLEGTEEYKDLAILEQVHLCDTVSVKFEKLGVNAKATVIKTEWDVLTGKYESIEIGNAKSSLSSRIAEQEAKTEQKPTYDFLAQAVQSAAKLITGNQGGFVRLNRDASGNPFELLIMDTDSINTAKNVWRFNKSGWGHSSTGYNGKYNLAATQSGAIVADSITAGTLRGIKVIGVDYYGNKKDDAGNAIFHVDADGNLTANSATLKGTVTAGAGSSMTGGTVNNSNITGGTSTDVVISNGNGTFTVDAAGNMKATSATIVGDVTANTGKIGPWVVNGEAIYNGKGIGVEGSCGISNIAGWAHWAGNGVFRVSETGELWASKAHITGDITANSGIFNGTVNASSGTFNGTVNASSGSFNGSITTSNIHATGGTIDNLTCKNLKLSSGNGCSVNAGAVTGTVSTTVVSDISGIDLTKGTVQEGGSVKTAIRATIYYSTKTLTLFNAKVASERDEKNSSYVTTTSS